MDYSAAEASRKRQAALIGTVLTDGDRKGERVGKGNVTRKGNPKEVTEALLLERARTRQEREAALAPPPLSWEIRRDPLHHVHDQSESGAMILLPEDEPPLPGVQLATDQIAWRWIIVALLVLLFFLAGL